MFTVLISSAGRRVGLLRLFQDALKELKIPGRVIAADCSRTSPAFHIADQGFQVPRLADPRFVETVLDICRREKAGLIVPTIDTELSIYADHVKTFADIGTRISVSSPDVIAISLDKVRTNEWARKASLETVRQWYGPGGVESVQKFPLIVKPRFGSASIGVHKVADPEELSFYLRRVPDPVVEEVATGKEFTINFFVGREGRVLSAVPHRRIEVRAGEVSKGITRKEPILLELAREVGKNLPGAFGALNFQCFIGDDGRPRIFEINARFGGGYPLAHQAGVNFPKWLLEEVLQLPSTAHFDGWEDGLCMLRYDEVVFVRREAVE